MNIVFLEFIDEAKAFISRYGKEAMRAPDIKVICLHPKVRAFLKKEGIDAEGTVTYLDNDAQHRIILKSEQWTKDIVAQIKIKDKFGVEDGYRSTCIHHMRLHFNHYLWILELLANVHAACPCDAIYASMPTDGTISYAKEGYIQDQERFLGFIARDYCKTNGITFKPILVSPGKNDLIERLIEPCLNFFATIMAELDFRYVQAKNDVDNRNVIVPGLSYRMDDIVKSIKAAEPKTRCYMVWESARSIKRTLYKIYLTCGTYIKKLKAANVIEGVVHLDLLKTKFPMDSATRDEINSSFDNGLTFIDRTNEDYHHSGVNVASYIKGKMGHGLRCELMDLAHLTIVFTKVLEALNPRLLMSMYSTRIYYIMGELSRRYQYRSLNISHGTHVPPNNEFEDIENYRLATGVILNDYTHVAVQTPWAERFLDHYKDSRPRVLSGPLLYSKTNDKGNNLIRQEILERDPKAKIVTHATTQKGRDGMRFHITETLDEYLKTLSDIIAAVNLIDHTYLLVRPHPACNLTEEEFRMLLPASDRIIIKAEGPFNTILEATDLLISFSSTCIEEAIQNHIPVVCYDRWKRYNHFNIPETRGAAQANGLPAYYVTEAKVLLNSINMLLDKEDTHRIKEDEISGFKYPEDYRRNFTTFIDETLNDRIENEHCAHIG